MALRFNPPPGWPAPHPGWTPPAGWQPDPAWPPVPPGWNFWVDDVHVPAGYLLAAPAGSAGPGPLYAGGQPAAPAPASWKWAAGGAAAVFVGSLLPFVSYSGLVTADVVPGARLASATFGIVLLGFALGLRRVASRSTFAGLLLAGGILGALGYATFILLGLAGFESSDDSLYSSSVTIRYDPSFGVTCCLAGCLTALVSAVQALRGR